MAEDKPPLVIYLHVFILQIMLWCLGMSGLRHLVNS